MDKCYKKFIPMFLFSSTSSRKTPKINHVKEDADIASSGYKTSPSLRSFTSKRALVRLKLFSSTFFFWDETFRTFINR